MEILLDGAKTGKENIFKPTAGYESFHKISKYIGIRAVNFVFSGSLIIKEYMFSHDSIHKYTEIRLFMSS